MTVLDENICPQVFDHKHVKYRESDQIRQETVYV